MCAYALYERRFKRQAKLWMKLGLCVGPSKISFAARAVCVTPIRLGRLVATTNDRPDRNTVARCAPGL